MPPKRTQNDGNPASRRMTHAPASVPPAVPRTIETRSRTSGLPAQTSVADNEPTPPVVVASDRPRSAIELGRNMPDNSSPTPFQSSSNDIRAMLQEVLLETRNLGARMDDVECLIEARSISRASVHSIPAQPIAVNAATAPRPSDDARNYLPLREEIERSRRNPLTQDVPPATLPTGVPRPVVDTIAPHLRSSTTYPPNAFPSDARSYRSEPLPRLRASDIGYWDPHGKVDSDDKHRPEQMSVQLFTKRLRRLAKKYGEQQVVDNIDAALVHCSSYLETLSEQDELQMESLSGWIHLLLRDFGEPEVIMRQKAQAYTCFDASSGNEFWQEKVSLLRRGGITLERDMYYEVWAALPPSWRETVPMEGSLDSLRSEIRRREAARGTWPSKRRSSNSSTDSGYDSRSSEQNATRSNHISTNKRGGSSGSFNNRSEKRAKGVSFSQSKPPSPCLICHEMGKPNEMHWQRECPNRNDQRAKVNRMLAILELKDESSSDLDPELETPESQSTPKDPAETEKTVNAISYDLATNTCSVTSDVPLVATDVLVHESNFQSPASLGSGDVFKRSGPIGVYVKSSITTPAFRICIDSGCGPVIGNREFVEKHWPSAEVTPRKSSHQLRVKGGFQKQEYEILHKFVVVPVYFITDTKELFHAQVEIHLTESYVDSNILFGVAGLKSNGLNCNFDKEVLSACSKAGESVEIPFSLEEPRKRVELQAIKATRLSTIPGNHEALIHVDLSHLPDRDYLFEGRQWITKGEISKAANGLVSNSTNKLLIGNFSQQSRSVHVGDIVGFISDLDDNDVCTSTNIMATDERPYLRNNRSNIKNNMPPTSNGYISKLAPIARVSSIKIDASCVSGRRVANRPYVVSESNCGSPQKEEALSAGYGAHSAHKRELQSIEQAHKAVPKLKKTSVDVAVALSSFLEQFEHEEYSDEPEIGVSCDDIRINPLYDDTVRALLVNETDDKIAPDHYVDDKWKFSRRLSPHQLSEAKSLLQSIDIWNGIGCLNTGECMPMPIKPEFLGKKSIQPSYPMSESKRKAYDKIEAELESQGIIEDSTSTDYCSPCLIVIQKNKPRFVIDFRKINDMTPADVYPLPRQTDIFRAMQGASYISLFDFRKMFYQMPIDKADRPKTTFRTRHKGAKQLTRSLMGYLNSPAHCQRIMDKIIKPYKWTFAVVYIDDLAIYSKSWEEHLQHLKLVLSEIKRVGLTLDAAKSYIGFESVNLLGHLVGRFGLAMQESKVAAMMDIPAPKSVKDVMQLLGFFGYYRPFIRNFAHIMEPISKLLASDRDKRKTGSDVISKLTEPVKWGEEQAIAFQRIKEALKNATYLSHALDGEDIRFKLYCDACKIGFGAALHIVIPANRIETDMVASSAAGISKSKEVERPCAFISRCLKKPEKQFWPTELEMAGLVWALSQFEELIEGRDLTIYTDHSALTWLFNATNSKTKHNQRLLIWALSLQKWKTNSKIVHRPGRAHVNADVLSRYPVDNQFPEEMRRSLDKVSDCPPIKSDLVIASITTTAMSDQFRKQLVDGYSLDPHWKSLYEKLKAESDKLAASSEYHNFRYELSSKTLSYIDPADKSLKLCIPQNCIQTVFKLNHDNVGHPGYRKSWSRMSDQYHIDKLAKKLKSYIGSCQSCCISKNKPSNKNPLVPVALSFTPGETIAMDFVNGLPKDDLYDCIMTITDKFSKMVTLLPCKTTNSAKDIADLFISRYYCRFGLPQRIISDRDPKFISHFWRELFSRLNVELCISTAYAPQTDGQSERSNQTMEVMLRTYVGYNKESTWVNDLPLIEYNINSQISEASDKTPFEILYGENPNSISELLSKNSAIDDPEITYIGERHQIIRDEVIQRLAWSRAVMAMHYDVGKSGNPLQIGDMVYIENRANFRIPGLDFNKSSPKRFGPFKVIGAVGKGAFKLQLPESYKIHDVLSARHLTKANKDEWNRIPEPPPPLHESNDEFEVECVIDVRRNKKSKEYLCKWKDYPVWESTWINESQRDTFQEAIDDFEKRNRKM